MASTTKENVFELHFVTTLTGGGFSNHQRSGLFDSNNCVHRVALCGDK